MDCWLPNWHHPSVTFVAAHQNFVAVAYGSHVEVWERGLGGSLFLTILYINIAEIHVRGIYTCIRSGLKERERQG